MSNKGMKTRNVDKKGEGSDLDGAKVFFIKDKIRI